MKLDKFMNVAKIRLHQLDIDQESLKTLHHPKSINLWSNWKGEEAMLRN